jgi:hypothetical protein
MEGTASTMNLSVQVGEHLLSQSITFRQKTPTLFVYP